MKTKKFRKKLVLGKSTISNLDQTSQKKVLAGVDGQTVMVPCDPEENTQWLCTFNCYTEYDCSWDPVCFSFPVETCVD